MDTWVKLHIVGLTNAPSLKGSYTLIFGTSESDLKLPVIVGNSEAQSIALVIEGIKPQRPLTHDLAISLIEAGDLILQKVLIDKLKEGVFHAKLVITKDGKNISIDSRTSDAIALALRAGCSIYTTPSILKEAGVILDTNEPHSPDRRSSEDIFPIFKEESSSLSKLSLDELNQELDKAIQIEDYDRAATLRDEIKKRK